MLFGWQYIQQQSIHRWWEEEKKRRGKDFNYLDYVGSFDKLPDPEETSECLAIIIGTILGILAMIILYYVSVYNK